MNDSSPTHDGPERRQESNGELRATLDEIARKVGDHPQLTGDDMSQLYVLLRDLYRRSPGSRSSGLLEIMREEHADDLNPALLALLDDMIGRRAGNE